MGSLAELSTIRSSSSQCHIATQANKYRGIHLSVFNAIDNFLFVLIQRNLQYNASVIETYSPFSRQVCGSSKLKDGLADT